MVLITQFDEEQNALRKLFQDRLKRDDSCLASQFLRWPCSFSKSMQSCEWLNFTAIFLLVFLLSFIFDFGSSSMLFHHQEIRIREEMTPSLNKILPEKSQDAKWEFIQKKRSWIIGQNIIRFISLLFGVKSQILVLFKDGKQQFSVIFFPGHFSQKWL